ncbi:hypothetical protein BH20VER3_BH20VER3_16130 [soil metagenome]
MMTAEQIKTAVGQIKNLPAEERREVAEMAYQELETETFGDQLRVAFAQGKLNQIIEETDAEYERDEALDRFC